MGAVLALATLVLLSSGCAARTALKRPDPEPIVTRVRLEGVNAFRRQEVASVLGQRATHPLHWIPLFITFYPAHTLDGTTWQEDRTRIANFYAERGYFDARVTGSQLKPGKAMRPDGSPLFVRIIHSVKEGKPSRYRSTEVVIRRPGSPSGGAEGSAADGLPPVEEEALRRSLGRGLPTLSGRRFSLSGVDAAEAQVLRRLHARSFARAEVQTHIDAHPESQAVDVRFEVVPGAKTFFGATEIHGLDKVRERYITRLIRWKEGEAFDGDRVNETQQAIYDMGLFSMVTVLPELNSAEAEGGADKVPISIQLRERKPRSFRFGGGAGWEIGRIDGHVSVGLGHRNLFRRLVQAELDLKVGYAFLGVDDHGPIGDLKVDLRWPDFPVRTMSLHTAASIRLEVEKAYKFWSPEVELGWTWSPLRPLRLHLHYALSYNDLFPDERLVELAAVQPDLALSDGYLLSWFGQSLVLDLRDQALAAGKGLLFNLELVETANPADSDLHYFRIEGDLRGYIPLGTPRIVLAARGGGAYVHPYNEGQDTVPINHRVYAGGDGSVRGWSTKYLGPRHVESAVPDPEAEAETTCGRTDCIVPLGGRVGLTGSLELRGNPFGKFWVAGFTDFGRVWASRDELLAVGLAPPEGLQFSVGGGLRYELPIGRLRLDVAFHPEEWTAKAFRSCANQPSGCSGERWVHQDQEQGPTYWNIHFGIGEAF